jgi:hypothetical protein
MLQLRDDFLLDNDNEEEQMKMLCPCYLGDGKYQIKFQNFVKLCVRTKKSAEKYIKKNCEDLPVVQIKNDQDLD